MPGTSATESDEAFRTVFRPIILIVTTLGVAVGVFILISKLWEWAHL